MAASVMLAARVGHLGHISLVAVNVVVDVLDAAVRQVDVIGAGGVLAVPLLAVAKVGGAVVAAVALLAAVTVHLVAKLEGESHMKLIIVSKISFLFMSIV